MFSILTFVKLIAKKNLLWFYKLVLLRKGDYIMNVLSIRSVEKSNLKTKSSSVDKRYSSIPSFSDKVSYISKNAANSLKSNSLNLARSIAFAGALYGSFQDLNAAMVTCKTEDKDGEKVGSRANVNELLFKIQDNFMRKDDAIKTTIPLGAYNARTQVKMSDESLIPSINDFIFEMVSRKKPDSNTDTTSRDHEFHQSVKILISPKDYKGRGTDEQAYVLRTKDNLMAVVEDGNNVLLTNAGQITKKDASNGTLKVETKEENNNYKPFVISQPIEDVSYEQTPSIGEGTEIVIGMEDGRFVNEIKDSIRTFVEKVNNGEIVLKPFVANPDAKNTQLVMLAGGFGSRAEYTNASSSAIFHDEPNGAQSTKGVFRTPTGLTPMETTFVTLHNAGLLDCSKGKISCSGDNANIKFYLNKSGVNKGNGGYSLDLYNRMSRDSRKQVMIFPNDSMSRLTNAVIEANNLVNSGKAAIAIVSKQIPAKDCIGTYGIMKLNSENVITDFAEKPKSIADDWIRDGNCLTNTFQFAVSDEAFKVLEMFEPYFSKNDKSKETRDWSKQYIPIIKTLTQYDDIDEIKNVLSPILKVFVDDLDPSIDDTIEKAKEILGSRKVYAVPTSEPWADCGTLNAMYHTVMQIVSGDFKLEPFERANAYKCVNTQTGLVTTDKDIKEQIESKYNIEGQVMVVPQAKKVEDSDVADIPVTVNEPRK